MFQRSEGKEPCTRLSIVTVGPGVRPRMQELADHLAVDLKSAKGFRSVTFLVDETSGNYGAFSLWDTKEDAEAAGAAIRPQIAQAFAGLMFPWIFEVYEPKGEATGG